MTKGWKRKIFDNITELSPDSHIFYLLINYLCHFIKHGYFPSKKNMKYICDYFFFLKNDPSAAKYSYFIDKDLVKNFISDVCGEKYVIHTLGVFSNTEELENFSFPDKYIVKPTHMSGKVIIKNGGALDKKEIQMAKKWLKQDYSKIAREYIYKNLKPKIIVEPLMEYNGKIPFDFKFFVINGKCEVVQLDLNRFIDHKRHLYDRNFKKLNLKLAYPTSPEVLKKPDKYSEMLEIAENLGSFFPFVRVDLYLTDEGIKFGELSFAPGGSLESFEPKEFEAELLQKLNLKSFSLQGLEKLDFLTDYRRICEPCKLGKEVTINI